MQYQKDNLVRRFFDRRLYDLASHSQQYCTLCNFLPYPPEADSAHCAHCLDRRGRHSFATSLFCDIQRGLFGPSSFSKLRTQARATLRLGSY